jgi:hypothetical protein
VVATTEPGGAPLRVADGVTADRSDPATAFDIVDWGNGVRALRAVANGRHVTVDADGRLVNDQLRPNGWVVRETFRLVSGADGDIALLHIASGRYVVAGADGGLGAHADSPEAATAFAVQPLSSGRSDAVRAAREADVAVVVVGNHPLINGRETEDRVDLALPPAQEALLRAVHAANPRTVVVVQSSYPYAIDWAQDHVPAILWSSHGGQEFGHALADVLFGVEAPAGRLTQTWYASAAELPDLLDYDIIAADATYLYFRGTALYPFGHGLRTTVAFQLRAADLAFWDVTRSRPVVEASRHSVMIGRSSRDIQQAATVTVRGEHIPSRNALAEPIPAAGHDDYAGADLRDASPTAGDTVSAAEPGAWIAFAQVDFGDGAGACRARISAAEDRTAVVTLRLDDPLQGSVIGTIRAACEGGRYAWVDTVAPLEGARGVHDLYAVFGSAGVSLDSLAFSPR